MQTLIICVSIKKFHFYVSLHPLFSPVIMVFCRTSTEFHSIFALHLFLFQMISYHFILVLFLGPGQVD